MLQTTRRGSFAALALLFGVLSGASVFAQGETHVMGGLWVPAGGDTYVDSWAGEDGLPYTADDLTPAAGGGAIPANGNLAGALGSMWIDLNGNGVFEEGDQPFARYAGEQAWSTRSYPEYGLLYESEDWNVHKQVLNEGPLRDQAADIAASAEELEYNDRGGFTDIQRRYEWEWGQNALQYNNDRDNQWGNGRKRYTISMDQGPGATFDEMEQFVKFTSFIQGADDPATPFNEQDTGCSNRGRDWMSLDDGSHRGIIIPMADIAGLQTGDLDALHGWQSVDMADYVRDTLEPVVSSSGFLFEDSTFSCGGVSLDGGATHLVIYQQEQPIVVNKYDKCAVHEDALQTAAYWGIEPNGADGDAMKTTDAVLRISRIDVLNVELSIADENTASRGWSDAAEDGVARNMYVWDNYNRRPDGGEPNGQIQSLGNYENLDGTQARIADHDERGNIINEADRTDDPSPWEIRVDAPGDDIAGIDWGCTTDTVKDAVLVNTSTSAGAITHSVFGSLDTTAGAVTMLTELGEYNIGDGGGGVPQDARHQMILLGGDGSVIAYAEISANGTTVNIGGTTNADGLAENPTTSSAVGPAGELGDGNVAAYTRFVLRASNAGVSLLQSFAGDYPIYRFDFMTDGFIYDEVASLSPGVSATVEKIRFATTGSGSNSKVAVDSLALWHNLEPDSSGNSHNPGDINLDGGVDISDPVAQLNFLFTGIPVDACQITPGTNPPALNATGVSIGDWNGDEAVDISDPVGSLNFQFVGAGNPDHVLGSGNCVPLAGSTCTPTCQ